MTPSASYGSPSYYAQKMFNTCLGDAVLSVTGENIGTQSWQASGAESPAGPAFACARGAQATSHSFLCGHQGLRKGVICLKVVTRRRHGASGGQINLKGVAGVAPEGTITTLSSAHPEDTNTITEPTKVVPVTSKISGVQNSFAQTFAPLLRQRIKDRNALDSVITRLTSWEKKARIRELHPRDHHRHPRPPPARPRRPNLETPRTAPADEGVWGGRAPTIEDL